MNQTKLLEKVDKFIESEGISLSEDNDGLSKQEKIKSALKVLDNSKNVTKHLSSEFRKSGSNFSRKLKNFILGKIANVVRNVMDKPMISQQTFNRQSYYIIVELIEQNKKLEKRVNQLEQNKKD